MNTIRTLLSTSVVAALLATGCGPARMDTFDSGPPMDTPGTDMSMVTCTSPHMLCSSVCIDPTTDNANCGSCNHACSSGTSCNAGVCTATCPSGETACGSQCVETSTDRFNCGACGHACPSGQVCSMGTCSLTCSSPLVMCVGAANDAGMSQPFCANTQTDRLNCGVCGQTCGAGTICNAGHCVASCPPPESVCGSICVDLTDDSMNCGTCGHSCGGQVCTAGVCGTTCGTGQTFCTDRCVDTQNDRTNCGTCGNMCGAGQICSAGTCAVVCTMGATLCSGACVNTQTDSTNCGTCGTTCASGEVCVAGACTATCAVGTAACGMVCVNLSTDLANCGSCGHACVTGQFCNGGTCGVSCVTGQTVCGGICVNTNVDPANCGGCSVSCGAGYACSAGLCAPLTGTDASGCSPPSLMCGTACTNIRSDNLNCGGCGRPCTADNTCVNGACVAPCTAGQMRCAGTCTNVQNDRNNCGACGTVCAVGLTCVAAACIVDPTFQILTLGTTASACTTINDTSVGGDFGGPFALSNTEVFYTGESSTERAAATNLAGVTGVSPIAMGLAYDMQAGVAYVLEDPLNHQPSTSSVTAITHLAQLDSTTGAVTATTIALSTAVGVGNSNGGVFSGYGRIILFTGTGAGITSEWVEIRLPSGTVTVIQPGSAPPWEPCIAGTSWAVAGVAEFFGGERYVDYIQGTFTTSAAKRYRISDGMTTTIQAFTGSNGLGETCTLGFSATLNQWYYRSFEQTQFTPAGMSRTTELGTCPGTFSTP